MSASVRDQLLAQGPSPRAAVVDLTKVSTLEEIAAFPTLERLTFEGSPGRRARDFTPVGALRGLRTLALPDGVKDLSFVAGLTELTSLVVGARRSAVADLGPLAGLARLERLGLPGAKVEDLAPLAGCAALRELELAGNKGVADLAPLAPLGGLERLDLNLTGVADLAPLARLARLRVLLLRGTKVTSLLPIAGLGALEELLAERSRLRSLDGVTTLRALRRLWVFDTKVKDLSPLGGLARLEELNVAGLGAVAGTDVVTRLPALARLDVFETEFDPELLRGRALAQVRGCDYPLPGSARLDEAVPVTRELGAGSVLDGRLLSVRASDELVGLALSPDGRELALAARGAVVRRVATADASERGELILPQGERATSCAYDSSGTLLVATRREGSWDCGLWRAGPSGLVKVASLRMQHEPRLAAHPVRPWVAVLGEGARVYDTGSWGQLLALPQDAGLHAATVGAFASALPRLYVHGPVKAKVLAWDLEAGAEAGRWDAAYAGGEMLSVSDDGRWVVSVGANCYGARVVDTTTGEGVLGGELPLERHGGAYVVTPDGTLLVECRHSVIGRRLPPGPEPHAACDVPVAGRIVPRRACVSASGAMLAFSTYEARLGDARAFLCPIGRV